MNYDSIQHKLRLGKNQGVSGWKKMAKLRNTIGNERENVDEEGKSAEKACAIRDLEEF